MSLNLLILIGSIAKALEIWGTDQFNSHCEVNFSQLELLIILETDARTHDHLEIWSTIMFKHKFESDMACQPLRHNIILALLAHYSSTLPHTLWTDMPAPDNQIRSGSHVLHASSMVPPSKSTADYESLIWTQDHSSMLSLTSGSRNLMWFDHYLQQQTHSSYQELLLSLAHSSSKTTIFRHLGGCNMHWSTEWSGKYTAGSVDEMILQWCSSCFHLVRSRRCGRGISLTTWKLPKHSEHVEDHLQTDYGGRWSLVRNLDCEQRTYLAPAQQQKRSLGRDFRSRSGAQNLLDDISTL